MKAYQLIEPDDRPIHVMIEDVQHCREKAQKKEGDIYLGEQGRIYVMRFCRLNPGWTWREVDDAVGAYIDIWFLEDPL